MDMIVEMSETYTRLEEDQEIRCRVIFAHGKHFTLGLELDSVVESLRTNGDWPIPA